MERKGVIPSLSPIIFPTVSNLIASSGSGYSWMNYLYSFRSYTGYFLYVRKDGNRNSNDYYLVHEIFQPSVFLYYT